MTSGRSISPGSIRRIEILRTADEVIAESGLRASLQQIAAAAGILPGSLYHHFESKEAILVELTRRYHADLDRIGEQAATARADTVPIAERIIALGRAIANCAVAHRAALQMSFYEAPSTDPELATLTRRRPVAIQSAMLCLLQAGQSSGCIRAGTDLPALADRLCQSMLHVGLDLIRRKAPAEQVAALLCRVHLHGLAAATPADPVLNRSAAFAAATEVVKTWPGGDATTGSQKAAHIRQVARTEFGRRGYEMTTIRDIATAAGTGLGTVYRVIGSKEELLTSIMTEFGRKVGAGWTQVMRSDASPVEKLDAVGWLNINALDRFPDEFRIQLAWMRQSPPDIADPGWAFGTRLRQLKAILSAGTRSGEIRVDSQKPGILARCVVDALWLPENLLRELGTDGALALSRDTVIRGAMTRHQG